MDAALSVGQRIGRYFALVSMIPALFLVLWAYILIGSGAPSQTPTLHNVGVALSHWSAGKVAGLVLATLAVAVVLHPLQFATTQLLEGYWGTTPLALEAMKIRIVHHRKRQRGLQIKAGDSTSAWRSSCEKVLREEREEALEEDDIVSFMQSQRGDPLMLHVVAAQEASARAASYPSDPTRILPTQLGNALRCFEDAAGKQYGLRALVIAPHLHLIVPPRHQEYLVDARQTMDTAIRICTVGLMATALTIGLLLPHGLWLLWAGLPYLISYLAYQGAVSAAQGYGRVIGSVIDLDRFLLYRKLGLSKPKNSTEELENNIELMRALTGQSATLRYRKQKGAGEGSTRPARPKKERARK
jgi:hypothetical protein